MLCIGLFGTCGGSTWRDKFMSSYNSMDINYFNPQVDDWKPELAEIEANHLVDDDIILFPVTNETFGTGSLAETGYSIMQAINSNTNRSVILMVSKDIKEELIISDKIASKESVRARALVRAHISKIKRDNIYFVETLDEMLHLSLELYKVHQILEDVRKYSVLK